MTVGIGRLGPCDSPCDLSRDLLKPVKINLHRLISAAIGRWVTSDPAELPFFPGRKKLCTSAVEYNPQVSKGKNTSFSQIYHQKPIAKGYKVNFVNQKMAYVTNRLQKDERWQRHLLGDWVKICELLVSTPSPVAAGGSKLYCSPKFLSSTSNITADQNFSGFFNLFMVSYLCMFFLSYFLHRLKNICTFWLRIMKNGGLKSWSVFAQVPGFAFRKILRHAFSRIHEKEEIPESWWICHILRLYKGKGIKGKCSNELGITSRVPRQGIWKNHQLKSEERSSSHRSPSWREVQRMNTQ